MRIRVNVKDKQIYVQCGEGDQPVRWLANAAINRYDRNNGLELGSPVSVTLEDGSQINMNSQINEKLRDGEQVFVQVSHSGGDAETGN